MEPPITSVSAYLAMLDTILKEAFPRVVIEGEISEWKVWNNQRVYFKLKDDKGAMDCVMWSLPRVPVENGMTVRITGRPNVYAARGSLNFSVSAIELAGEGTIKRAYELLKAKLTAEGIFAAERKRALPLYPTRIGLITAADSAAYADFMKIIDARWVGLEISFVPVQVQGTNAPDQLVGALQTLNELAEPVEVVALIRGGGSLEDLQAFNAEQVVRAVATSRVPVISGVGHEVDTSLADLAADVRAATPTDAANRIVPDKREVVAYLDRLAQEQAALVTRRIEEQLRVVLLRQQRLDGYVRLAVAHIDAAEARLRRYPVVALRTAAIALAHQEEKLGLLDPKAVLRRGFAIARVDGRVVKTATAVRSGQTMMIELAQDSVETTVTEVHRGTTNRYIVQL